MTTKESVLFFLVITLATMATRFLPFLLFPDNKKTPKYVEYLGAVLPYAIIGMLVIYCLKDVSLFRYPFGLPEVLGVGAVVILQLWRKNMLLSIGFATVLYMWLVQTVFL